MLAIHPASIDVAVAFKDLADAERLSGDFNAAEMDYLEAQSVSKMVGYQQGITTSAGYLAQLALDRKDWGGGEDLAREAMPLAEELGRQEVIAEVSRCLAQALARQGKKVEGLPYARRAVEIYTRLGSPELEGARATLAECEG